MDVVRCDGAVTVAVSAADMVEALLLSRRRVVLGVATGSSPAGLYRELARRRPAAPWPAEVSLVLLDEYVGLPAGHPQGYREVVLREVAGSLAVPGERVLSPDGRAADLDAEAVRYEAAVAAAGGVDLQIVGIGANGHLAFNEPPSGPASQTRVVALSARTRADNARFFGSPEQVPTHAITQGIATILRARRVLLLALGTAKASAVAAAVDGPLSDDCPASALQLHPRVSVLTDPAAAAALVSPDLPAAC